MKDRSARRETNSLEEIVRACKNTLAGVHENQIRFWHKLVGSELAPMLRDRLEAECRLTHVEPTVRYVALGVLIECWKAQAEREFAKRCEEMAAADPDSKVRAAAMCSLGICYLFSNDPRIGKFFAQTVIDECLALEVRHSAYSALFGLRGITERWPGEFSDPPTPFRFPDDVNWAFVREFLDETLVLPAVDPLKVILPHISDDELKAQEWFDKGEQALDDNRAADAIGFLTESLRYSPHACGTILRRAEAFTSLEKLDDAIADYSAAIGIDSESPILYRRRAELYRKTGNLVLAEEDERMASLLEE